MLDMIWTTHAEHLIERAYEDGGVTTNPLTGGAPIAGFMVGGVVPSLKLDRFGLAQAGRAAAVAATAEWLAENYVPGAYVGSWYDDGDIWIDVSDHVMAEERADRLTREREELAYYDVSNKTSIYV